MIAFLPGFAAAADRAVDNSSFCFLAAPPRLLVLDDGGVSGVFPFFPRASGEGGAPPLVTPFFFNGGFREGLGAGGGMQEAARFESGVPGDAEGRVGCVRYLPRFMVGVIY